MVSTKQGTFYYTGDNRGTGEAKEKEENAAKEMGRGETEKQLFMAE